MLQALRLCVSIALLSAGREAHHRQGGLADRDTDGQAGRHSQAGYAAHPAPQLGNASARRRDRSAHYSAVARSCGPGDNGQISAPVSQASAAGRQPYRDSASGASRAEPPLQESSTPAMSKPALEVADILRAQGSRFLEHYQRSISYQQLKVYRAVLACRTASLGGHLDVCSNCGLETGVSFNSCRNRHCPKCQARAREQWLEARQQELLPIGYFHVVFTVPHELNVFALASPRQFYDLLFSSASETLIEVARNPERLGADIGALAILHTWGQNLLLHPHLHCVVPAGGLSADRTRWLHTQRQFLLPLRVLR